MRTIKFRGKRTDTLEWVYGYYAKMLNTFQIKPKELNIIITEKGDYDVLPESVGQWTGLVGKNGVEIYEGDILKMHQFLFDGNEYEKETIGVIKWGEYGWLLSQIDGKEVNEYMGYKNGEGETYLIHFYGLHEESFEIIANVFDNGDLYDC